MYVVTPDLTRRLEEAEATCWWGPALALAELPENPYGLELERFGKLFAFNCTWFPEPSFFNRVLCAGPDDGADLERALSKAAGKGLRLVVEVNPGNQDRAFLQYLQEQGLAPKVFCSVLYAERPLATPALPPGVAVRRAESAGDLDLAIRLHREGMGVRGRTAQFHADTWREAFGLPGYQGYLAYVDGEPAGQAWLHTAGGVGSLVAGATLPAFRGRGVQKALIHRRMADAAAAGCDLLCSQTDPCVTSQNNMERCGFRVAYTKVEFHPV